MTKASGAGAGWGLVMNALLSALLNDAGVLWHV